jgi:hypothetical protein
MTWQDHSPAALLLLFLSCDAQLLLCCSVLLQQRPYG